MDVLQLLLIIRYNIDFIGGDIDRNSASAEVVTGNFGLHSGLAKCESCTFGHFRLRRKPKIWPSVGLYCEFEIFRRKIFGNFSNLSGNFQ